MTVHAILSFGGALFSAALAVWILWRDTRSLAHRAFAGGMLALAVEAVFGGLSARALSHAELVGWERLRLVATAVLPGLWLLVSVTCARANPREFMARWRWALGVAFAVPLGLVTLFADSLYLDGPALETSVLWMPRLGWSGYGFHLFFLLGAVLILMNLERTLRESTGTKRRQIKFMLLGLGGLFGARVYVSSQALLFSTVDPRLEVINTGALLVAGVLIAISLVRAPLLSLDIYLSHTVLTNSCTALIAGAYLLAVGLLATVSNRVGGSQMLPLGAFATFLALLGLATVLLSERLRHRIKRFVSRHFRRPRYDYGKQWLTFTGETTSLLDLKALTARVAKIVSETFGVPAVNIWMWEEAEGRLALEGSTAFSGAQAEALEVHGSAAVALARAMRERPGPADLEHAATEWAGALRGAAPDVLRDLDIRYGVPLTAGREVLGVMTLSDRVTGEAFSVEDWELLKTLADQAAASLLNVRLSQRLLKAKETEVVQRLAACLLHDLKNLVSGLSLMMQNLERHHDNPAFRRDALSAISQSLARIKAMCNSLSLVGQPIEFQPRRADLNALVQDTLSSLDGLVKRPVTQRLEPLPELVMDPEQIQKVLTNLVLNAAEAMVEGGEIRVTTERRGGWVILSVSDDGCGIPREFAERSLFRPFQTTKKHGLGIGLFHSKLIAEAHRGKIEVTSEEGSGSTFRVMLPLAGSH